MTPHQFNKGTNWTSAHFKKAVLLVCLAGLASILSACEPSSSSGSSSSSPSVTSTTPVASASDQQTFEATLRPLLVDPNNGCVACHGDLVNQDPKFAAADPATAYNILISQQKINLVNPELSRIYLRPNTDRHNCGGNANCDRIAADFLAAIRDWSAQAAASGPPTSNGRALVSAASNFAMATGDGNNRADSNAIALFTFSEGSGDVVMDSSGVSPAIALQVEGMEWVEGGGLRNVSGKAQASLADSRKLFDRIVPGNEYSIEAWVIPENTAQDGPARIVSYSQDTAARNFTLGQNAIYYQLRNSSASTGANGTPALEALDPQTDTVLQHVVVTFDGASGRKVYINGQLRIEENSNDNLTWQDSHLLVLGNEVTNNRLWQGVFKLVAIHEKALSPAEVQQNFDAGTDSIVRMRFDVTSIIGQSAYIEMQVAQLDAAGYLFAAPVFVSDAAGIAIKNIRIGVNGSVPVAAQPFRRIDTVVNQSGMELSPLGAVIPVELGSETDQFHLEFEVLGNQFGSAEFIAAAVPPVPLADVPEPQHGVRTFSQINDTMSSLTGIDAGQAAVLARYTDLRDSLPATPDLLSFAAAQQIAIQRLATTYCGAVVSDAGNCNDFFPGCAVDGNDKSQVASVLYDRFIGANLANQPDRQAVTTEIVRTIDDLGCSGGCSGVEAQTVLQATCTAVLSSGAVILN